MTEPDIICEICTRWQIVQYVNRDEPNPRGYVIHINSMQCKEGHKKVIERNCPDFDLLLDQK